MKYQNATSVLPEDLIERLQDFVQGEYLYIPAKKENRKSWGELSGTRREIDKRNQKIIKAHEAGTSIDELADTFFLSIYAIRKIIYAK
jgi:Mor family transcriptional regulator